MTMTKGAIGNLINRYCAVLKKCSLLNVFGSMAVAVLMVLGASGAAEAVEITNRTVENQQVTGDGGAGAEFNNTGVMTVTGSTFRNNAATGNGGAISNKRDPAVSLTVDSSHFTENAAGQSSGIAGAIYFGHDSSGVITNSAFDANTAKWGGAVYTRASNTSLAISDSSFTGNKADGAGALGLFGRKASTLNGVTFTNNQATDTTEDGGGGAVFIGSEAQVTMNDVTFASNKSEAFGGAITTRLEEHGNNAGAKLDITKGTFTNNKAAINGGAIYSAFMNSKNNAGAVSIQQSAFSGNSAGKMGGAIYNAPAGTKTTVPASLHLEDVTFTNNSAGENGGAIYNAAGAKIAFAGVNVFSGNQANGLGNDIHNLGSLNIKSGATTLGGGITGAGTLDVAAGATLDIGTTTVAQGSVTLAEGSTLRATFGPDAFGKVQANTITIDKAKLDYVANGAGAYNFLLGTINGDFTALTSSLLYDAAYANGTLTLTAKKSDDIVQTIRTQTGLNILGSEGNAINTLAAGLDTGAAHPLIQQLFSDLQSSDLGTKQRAVQQLASITPRPTSALSSTSTGTQNQLAGLTSMRMSGPSGAPSGPLAMNTGRSAGDGDDFYGLWVQGLYNKAHQSSSGTQTPGFTGYTRGIALGVDKNMDALTFGFGYAYGDTDITTDGTDTDVASHNLFAYGQYKPNNWYVNGMLNLGFSDYKDTSGLRTARYDAAVYGAQAMVGYDFGLFAPEAGLRYTHISPDSYTDSLGTHVSMSDSDLLTGIAGARMKHAVQLDNGSTLAMELRAAATYDFKTDDNVAVVRLAGSAAPYESRGEHLERLGFEGGAGVTWSWHQWDLALTYEIGAREKFLSQSGMFKLMYKF